MKNAILLIALGMLLNCCSKIQQSDYIIISYGGSLMNHPIVSTYIINEEKSDSVDTKAGYIGVVPPVTCIIPKDVYTACKEEILNIDIDVINSDSAVNYIQLVEFYRGNRINNKFFYGKDSALKFLNETQSILTKYNTNTLNKAIENLEDYKNNIIAYWE